jgi:hypothetical protein
VPGWAGFFAGLGGGLAVTAFGVYYAEWSRRRRKRRAKVAEQVARLRALLADADPRPYAVVPPRERDLRKSRLASARWAEILAPLRRAGLLASTEINEAAQWVAFAVPHSIRATKEIADADDPGAHLSAHQTAVALYEQARASVHGLEYALTAPWWKRRLRGVSGAK